MRRKRFLNAVQPSVGIWTSLAVTKQVFGESPISDILNIASEKNMPGYGKVCALSLIMIPGEKGGTLGAVKDCIKSEAL